MQQELLASSLLPNEFAEDGRKDFVENPRLERFAFGQIAFSEDVIKPLLGNTGVFLLNVC